MAVQSGRSLSAPIYGDPGAPRTSIEEARRAGNRRGVTFWRQVLTVSAAAQRAKAGDRTVARRLVWRALVLKGRRHAQWLVSRAKAYEVELTRLRREPSHPDCAACYQRQERSRGHREEFLAEIAQLPGSVPTYRASRRLDFRAALEGNHCLLNELEPLLRILEAEGRAVHERRRLRVLDGGRT